MYFFYKKGITMKNILKLTLITAALISANLVEAAGRDVVTNTYSCCVGNCQQINCQSGTANAVGDTRKIDTSAIKFTNLGTISSTKFVTLNVPTDNAPIGYTITFASGAYANQAIQFVALYVMEGNEHVYKFFRKAPKATLFTEVGSLHAGGTLTQIQPVITPDGKIVTVDQGKPGIMDIATNKL